MRAPIIGSPAHIWAEIFPPPFQKVRGYTPWLYPHVIPCHIYIPGASGHRGAPPHLVGPSSRWWPYPTKSVSDKREICPQRGPKSGGL